MTRSPTGEGMEDSSAGSLPKFSDFSDLPESPHGSIRARLLGSHLLIASLGVALLLAALYLLYQISDKTRGIAEEIGPESESYLHVLSGVERSVADVFAFMVLKDESIRRSRARNWTDSVAPAMARLITLAQGDDAQLVALSDQVEQLKASLTEAEALSASPDNIPADVIYTSEIRPLLDSLKSDFLSVRIQLQEEAGSEALLGDIGYAWGAIAVSEGALRDFIQFGNPGEEMLFLYWTDETSGVLAQLTPGAHAGILEHSRETLSAYRDACQRAIEARKAPDWNRALHLFESDVRPLALRVIETLQDRAFQRSSETLGLSQQLHTTARRALGVLVILGSLMALLGVWISGRQSAEISGPLIELAQAARELADEKYTRDLDVARNDEIGYVVATFNAMRNTLKTRRREILAAQDALRASETRYRLMMENSPTPYIATAEDAVIYMNEAAVVLFRDQETPTAVKASPTLRGLLGEVAGGLLRDYSHKFELDGDGSPPLELAVTLNERLHYLEIRGARIPIFGTEAVLFSLHDVTERENLQRDLRRLSDIDALTGVPNRRALDDQLEAHWSKGCATGKSLSFILTDIDYFKRYNDNYGHQAGDECLRQVAALLQSSVRSEGDMLARYGGEEFAFLLTDTTMDGAWEVANRALRTVREANIPHAFSGAATHVSISMGLFSLTPSTRIEMREVIERADQALYRAKELGRDQAVAG